MQRNWDGKIALVTGASSGIGWATAEQLAARGLRVAVTARRAERLAALVERITAAGGTAFAFPADLAERAAREALVAAVGEQWGPVQVLINNAGFGWGGDFAAMPWDTAEALLGVNVTALTHLTRLVLPEMAARREGWIVNVASIAGDLPLPSLVLYCASKTYVQAFSEGLYREVARQGIHVAVVNPGPIVSEFGAVAYGWSDARAEQHGAPTAVAAQAIWRALDGRRKRVYVPWYFRLGRWVNLLLEWPVDHGLSERLRALTRRMARHG